MSNFAWGDKVICIATDNTCKICGNQTKFPTPIIGRWYRVDWVGIGVCRRCGNEQPAISTAENPDGHCWPEQLFTKPGNGSMDEIRRMATPVLEDA